MVWRKVLSDREIEVSGLVSNGFTNKQIGKKLNISEATVKTHIRNIYSKTGIHDRANLAIRILNSGKT
jgi:DNA-binding NarL/FixJ family response regulator|tara:strand:+ start:460 stop:663 length:204 start_codon:yes stop_codon:yes gene_type:complete